MAPLADGGRAPTEGGTASSVSTNGDPGRIGGASKSPEAKLPSGAARASLGLSPAAGALIAFFGYYPEHKDERDPRKLRRLLANANLPRYKSVSVEDVSGALIELGAGM